MPPKPELYRLPAERPVKTQAAVVLCTAGRLMVCAGEKTLTLAAGELLCAEGPVTVLLGSGKGWCLPWPRQTTRLWHAPAGGAQTVLPPAKERAQLEQELFLLADELSSDALGASQMARALATQCAVLAARLLAAAHPPPQDAALPAEVLARRCIEASYAEPLTLELLSARFYVSKYHLSHAFCQRYGMSVYRCLMLRRLEAARAALDAGASPGEAFAGCGFGDYANFYRAFKTRYGHSPRAYAADCRAKRPETSDKEVPYGSV